MGFISFNSVMAYAHIVWLCHTLKYHQLQPTSAKNFKNTTFKLQFLSTLPKNCFNQKVRLLLCLLRFKVLLYLWRSCYCADSGLFILKCSCWLLLGKNLTHPCTTECDYQVIWYLKYIISILYFANFVNLCVFLW